MFTKKKKQEEQSKQKWKNGPFGNKYKNKQYRRGWKKQEMDEDLLNELKLKKILQRIDQHQKKNKIDDFFGFKKLEAEHPVRGWLVNIRTTTIMDERKETMNTKFLDTAQMDGLLTGANEDQVGIELYFLGENFDAFRVVLYHAPYFFVGIKQGYERAVESYLRKKDPENNIIEKIEIAPKRDLDQLNHLAPQSKTINFLKVSFKNIQRLLEFREIIQPIVERNRKRQVYDLMYDYDSSTSDEEGEEEGHMTKNTKMHLNTIDAIIDMREFDVQYHVRQAIDNDYRIGYWYEISHNLQTSQMELTHLEEDKYQQRPDPKVCAFDIETTKKRLMFPDYNDSIMMISYMIDGQGYLIVNREIVAKDIDDFEYTPKPEYPGPFTVFNVADERGLLEKWYSHMKQEKPVIYVTYNGDFFDFPFIEARSKVYGISMYDEIGYKKNRTDNYESSYGIHMDCFCWVKRDSYLPHGSHGLKAVTHKKLGYRPVEVDPEMMVPLARDDPVSLAQYSVSDAVATYYLYMKYVHPFIFSLCTLIPMSPDEVLRKGSGTLCESLLMVQAQKANVVFPNKHKTDPEKAYKGHILKSETYVGGHVEALRAGVYRSDLEEDFDLDPSAFDELIGKIDEYLTFALTVEQKVKKEDVTNYDEVKNQIISELKALRDRPKRTELPQIYHLDVGAMYPNIILTNRLQPMAIVDDTVCASCVYNNSRSNCKRKMPWTYRLEYFNANKSEFLNIKNNIMSDMFPNPYDKDGPWVPFKKLKREAQQEQLKQRLQVYSRKAYGKTYTKEQILRYSTVCMRENSFYIDTIQRFRDRRYEYKKMLKTWQRKESAAEKSGNIDDWEHAKKMVVLYDSLQVAHKCILNSFYGYVMRKGARWYSLEMAGIVTYNGAGIIKTARELVDRIGIGLELDTDGIWCLLPRSFPEDFTFKLNNGRSVSISYPCVMLNADVYKNTTNHQYQDLREDGGYDVSSRCEIFFEVDGPYRAMILPASKEEGKGIKKRYAVYDKYGKLVELKGFELKRRGELEMLKIMQKKLFDKFLEGNTLKECYDAVGAEANHFLNILDNKGEGIDEELLFSYITESSNMSKALDEYDPDVKSSRITTAKRLKELFGDNMAIQSGLKCSFIVSKHPIGKQVSQRCIPITVFQLDKPEMLKYLKKWTGDDNLTFDTMTMRHILDWNYYKERIGGSVQKIISIPAALQGVENPCPSVEHPGWLKKRIRERKSTKKQKKMGDFFNATQKTEKPKVVDIEDLGTQPITVPRAIVPIRKRKRKDDKMNEEDQLAFDNLNQKVADPSYMFDASFWNHEKFDRWFQHLMKTFEQSRDRRKRRKAGFIENTSSVGNIETYSKGKWHIVELRHVPNKNQIQIFFTLENDLDIHQMFVTFQRSLYQHYLEKQVHLDKPLTKVLPRNMPRGYLYESKTNDVELENSHVVNDLSQDTVGLYGTKQPVLFDAVLKLGNVSSIRQTSRDAFGTQILKLDHFQRHNSQAYLNLMHLQNIYLYSQMEDNRGIFALVFPKHHIVELIILQPVNNHQKPNMNRLLQKAMDAKQVELDATGETLEVGFDASKMQFRQKVVSDLNDVFVTFDFILKEYASDHASDFKQSVLLCKSNLEDMFFEKVAVLQALPKISLVHSVVDHRQKLNWLSVSVNIFVKHLVDMHRTYQRYVQNATYGSIPMGNIGTDHMISILDVKYARELLVNQHVLWCSETVDPDFGEGAIQRSEEQKIQKTIEINHPGLYHGICVELSLWHLDINSMIQAHHIDELLNSHHVPISRPRNEELSKKQFKSLYLNDDEAGGPAFTCLTKTVEHCLADIASSTLSHVADNVISNVYRYVHSPSALLYDPILAKLLYAKQKKVFLALLAQCEKMGTKVIFADFGRVILHLNNKNLVEDCIHHMDLLITNLRKQKLFSWIEIKYQRYFQGLLWIDPSNYSGIALIRDAPNDAMVIDDDPPTSSQPAHDEMADEEEDEEIMFNKDDATAKQIEEDLNAEAHGIHGYWSLARAFPLKFEIDFNHMIWDFLSSMQDCKVKFIDKHMDSSFDIPYEDALNKHLVHEATRIIEGRLTKDLIELLPELRFFHFDADIMALYKKRNVYSDMTLYRDHSLALYFVNTICHVLMHDRAIEPVVFKMHTKLLNELSIQQYSTEAKLRLPHHRFVLPNILCESCLHVSNLDLINDKAFISNPEKLPCLVCSAPLRKSLIEDMLIQRVTSELMAYQLQDLRCLKCRSIQESNLSNLCHRCGYAFTNKRSGKYIKTMIQRLTKIAHFYNFEWLLELLGHFVHD